MTFLSPLTSNLTGGQSGFEPGAADRAEAFRAPSSSIRWPIGGHLFVDDVEPPRRTSSRCGDSAGESFSFHPTPTHRRTEMPGGSLRCVVINVTDLRRAESFWSEVTGLRVISSNYTDRFSYLGHTDSRTHEMILQLVREPKGEEANAVTSTSLSTTSTGRSSRSLQLASGQEGAEYLSASGIVPGTATGDRLGGDNGSIRKRILPRE